MPRKAKAETTTIKTKKPTATKASKAKPTESNITETPKHSEIILDYNRFGNIGFSHMHETVGISFLDKKKLTGKITTLFHFIRQTEVCKNLDSSRTAIFKIDGRPVISIVQKAGDYENQVFTLTKYKGDGTRQSTRKYSYNKVKNLILDVFGFETKTNENAEESETSNEDMDSKNMGNMEVSFDTENFGDDTSNEFDDVE